MYTIIYFTFMLCLKIIFEVLFFLNLYWNNKKSYLTVTVEVNPSQVLEMQVKRVKKLFWWKKTRLAGPKMARGMEIEVGTQPLVKYYKSTIDKWFEP